MLQILSPEAVVFEWARIAKDLRRALDVDKTFRLLNLKMTALSGRILIWRLAGEGAAHFVTWGGNVCGTDVPALWVLYAGGKVNGGPKRRLATMRAVLAEIEGHARAVGCAEVRVEDRPTWGVVLDGYERSTKPNGGALFRKVL
jgi:hypothetical protein